MEQSSIFAGVVKGEDAYTNLLRNMMLVDRDYRFKICNLLRPEGQTLGPVGESDLQTQVPLKTPFDSNLGRADLLIKTNSSLLLVEVKIGVYCGLTENQNFFQTEDSERFGYLKYLEYYKNQNLDVGLCLLVPRSWKHRISIDRQLAVLDQQGVPAHVKTWEEVFLATDNPQFSEFVQQFGKFLEVDFMTITFDAKEASLLTSQDGLANFGAASLKLHELVKQATKELKLHLNQVSDIKFEVKDLWGDASEQGATIYRGDKRLLWFGTWSRVQWPLIVALDRNWSIEEGSLCFDGLSSIQGPERWNAFKLPENCFTGDQPLPNLVSALSRIIRL